MSFDTLAPHYRWMELLLAGGVMQRGRIAHLEAARHCRSALLLGEGPGRFLTRLLRLNPQVQVTCLDQSKAMIRSARRQLVKQSLPANRVEFVCADVRSWTAPQNRFDLVVTNYFLDCFRPGELKRLIESVAKSVTPDAQWLLSDFTIPSRGWRRWRAELLVFSMYVFFRAVTGLSAERLTPVDDLLRAAGFELRRRRRLNFELIQTDLWVREMV